MIIRTAAVVTLGISLLGLPAHAAETNKETASVTPTDAGRSNASAHAADADRLLPPVEFLTAERPAALSGFYISLAALQAFDVYSTRKGLALGASEANPLMKGLVGRPAVLWTIKAATTVGTMMIAERMWKTNRAGAIAVMVIANSVAATVAANNARVIKQLR